LLQAIETLGAISGVNDLETEPRQAAIDQPGQPLVIVDIQ
jgi:hypothetical protein